MTTNDHYWAIPDLVMAGPWPTSEMLDWLYRKGTTDIVNLTEEDYEDERFHIHHIPIGDYMAPEMEQIEVLCDIVDDAKATEDVVYIHCFAGCGRTGTMTACLLVTREGFTAEGAIEEIRELEPCSIESDVQEESVYEWEGGPGRARRRSKTR